MDKKTWKLYEKLDINIPTGALQEADDIHKESEVSLED